MSDKNLIEVIEEVKRKKGIDRALAENTALLSANRGVISEANIDSAKAISQKELNEEIVRKFKKFGR